MIRSNEFFNAGLAGALDPATLVAVASLVVALVLLVDRSLPVSGQRRGFRRRRPPPVTAAEPRGTSPAPDVRDPARQLQAVALAGFRTVPLLNRSEARLLPALEAVVRDVGKGCRLMAQTSLGEVLAPTATGLTPAEVDLAHASINSKRLDFAVFDRFGHLVLAIEYQGDGHYHQTSFLRDAVKREALRKAGVPMLELPAGIAAAEAAARVAEQLRTSPRLQGGQASRAAPGLC
jgi:hypothetical protein